MICYYCEKEIERGKSFVVDGNGRPYHPDCWQKVPTMAHSADYPGTD